MKDKESRENITMLYDNEVFVFGSNLAGIHGKGAARLALVFGAKYGKGEGHYGKTYGIPTKDSNIVTLDLSKIETYVNRFISYAKENPTIIFQVTQIGCGLAGYKAKDIAPFFKEAINLDNVKLPKEFLNILINND